MSKNAFAVLANFSQERKHICDNDGADQIYGTQWPHIIAVTGYNIPPQSVRDRLQSTPEPGPQQRWEEAGSAEFAKSRSTPTNDERGAHCGCVSELH